VLVGCSGCKRDRNRVLVGFSGCERDRNRVLVGFSGCERDRNRVLVGCSGCERDRNMTLVDTILMMLNHLQLPYSMLATKLLALRIHITLQQSSFWSQRLVGPVMAAVRVRHTVPVA